MTASGISETTAQADAMLALIAAAKLALADEEVDIGYGFRWPIVNFDWFFGEDTSSDIDPADIGPRRSLREQITLTVSIGTWTPYDPDADEASEVEALSHAFALLGKVQNYIRTQDVTLGGTVLWCMPGSSTSKPTRDTESGIGRLTEIAATWVCEHRIASA